jgi:signal transduction histidine kinase
MLVFDRYLSRLTPWDLLALCASAIAGIGLADYLTGYELSLAMLYLAPIFLAGWVLGTGAAITAALASTITWLASALLVAPAPAHRLLLFWDAGIELVTFLLFGVLVAKLKTALEHADERFATVLEGLDAAVYVEDERRGEVLYSNERFASTFGEGADLKLPPGGLHDGEVHDVERGRWYLVKSREIRWVDGRRARLRLATDITESRQAEALLRQQQEKFQMTARLIAVGEMASAIAHELNQPLAAIANYNMGCVRRLRAGNVDTAALLEAMEKAAAQAERASQIVQRVRALVARRPPELVACRINDIVRGIASIIELEAAEIGARVELELAEDVPEVQADRILMEQVILNLAHNAMDALREVDLEQRRLRIRSQLADSTVEVEVQDEGSGIDPSIEANMFKPFFSTKPEGMGLGLHICRSILEAHRGHLWVTRNPERGASFHFSLPVA